MKMLSLLLALSSAAHAAEFEVALWPGEGRPVLEAAAAQIPLRPAPEWTSCPSVVTVNVGAGITFDDTRYRTMRAGEAVALRRTTLTGRSLGAIRRLSREAYYRPGRGAAAVTVEAGDAVAYLQPRAEGTCLLRIGGEVVEADPCALLDPRQFRITEPPLLEWWVHADLHGTRGWTRVDGEHLKLAGRTF